MIKLAIITTHPIQYYAPVFKLLAQKLDVKVFYTWGKQVLENKYDPGFKKQINWDVPLLDGYHYHFTQNDAKNPGSHHQNGIINPNLISEIKEYNPSAILVYGYAYDSHFKVMKYFKGKIPVYFRGDSHLLDKNSAFKSILKYVYLHWVYRYVDYVFYVGKSNKAYFEYYGLKENQLIFAPHSIDNERFSQNQNAEAKAIRSKFGLKETDILILYAGKFEPKKNPLLLLNSFIKLNKSNIFLLFLGNGILEVDLKKQVDEAKIHHKVFFEDFKNQSILPMYYQASDLFCLPSQGPGETWGLAINEAMATSKAILVSNKVGCAKDLVINGVNGFIFEAQSDIDFFEKLAWATSDKQKLSMMGSKSFEIISNYSFEIQVKNMAYSIYSLFGKEV